MHIDSDVRKILIDPVLDGSLSIPVDQFVLDPSGLRIPLAASLRASPKEDGFTLDVRDADGRDFRTFFSAGSRVTVEDTLTATGTLGEKLRVEFRKIWPPCRSTTRPIGDVNTSSAVLEPEVIEVCPSESDSMTHAQIRLALQNLNSRKRASEQDEIQESNTSSHEHIAIFANTKLQFLNGGIKWEENHPFWGSRSGSKDATWDGEALGGRFSLRQAGEHLELGFVHEGEDDDDAVQRFDSLVQAIAYTHAIFPWPTFLQRRCNFRVVEQTLRIARQEQGSMVPLRDRDGFESPNSPTDLIAAVAGLFFSLPPKKKEELKEALWVFRGADSRIAPAPLQMAMICSVIEGLRTELFSHTEVPPEFTKLHARATKWLNELRQETVDPSSEAMIQRLTAHIGRWSYNDRRVEWNDVFGRLFPGRGEWVLDLFKLFNKHRHGPAHGNFGSIARGDPHASIDALGRLAGLVNLTVAAMANYKGPMLESPFADRRIDVGAGPA